MEGWIKLYRKFMKWEWYEDSKMVHLFIHLLLNANRRKNRWKGIEINRGQLITSYSSLKGQTKITTKSLRLCLNKLKETGEVAIKTTNKYSIVTICHYDNYQILDNNKGKPEGKPEGKRGASKGQAKGKPEGNKQEEENILKKEKTIKEEKKEEGSLPNKSADFIDEIVNCFIKEYGNYEIINKGKERAAAGKLLNFYKNKYPESNTEETLQALQHYFKMCINIDDDWLKKNMSLSLIISKFNEINKILKNGKTGNKKGATPEQIASAVAKIFADDYSMYSREYGTD